MPTMWNGAIGRSCGAIVTTIVCLVAGTGCDEKKAAVPAAEDSAAVKAGAPEGGPCKASKDCAYGLSCAPDQTCQTAKTIECRERDETCKAEGRCTGRGGKCVATSSEECKKAQICESDGKCTMKDGRCLAASANDCAALCQVHGRCSIEDGKCVAASDDDCKDSAACKTAKRCSARNGRCLER